MQKRWLNGLTLLFHFRLMSKKRNEIALTVYLLCKNKLVKEYGIIASRKFNIGDETYVIKRRCCYPRLRNGQPELVSFYSEGNPNPHDLRKPENKGLNGIELDRYVSGDVYNIIIECQRKDKTRYIFNIAVFVCVMCFIQFITGVIFGF